MPCDVPLPEHAAKHNAAPQQIHKRIAIFIKQPTRQPETADYNSIAPSPALNRILQAQNLYNRAQPLFSAHRNPSRKTAMQYLGIALLILIFAEIFSIIFITKLIGGLATLGLMILAFMLGSFLMKRSAGLSQLLLAGGILRTGPLGGAPGPNSQQQNPFNSHNPFAQSPFTRGSGDDGDIIEGDFVVRDGKPQRQPENKHQPDLIEHKK